MKVAAYQAPYLPFGSVDAIGFIKEQVDVCQAAGVEILCCPEAIIGGMARQSDGQRSLDVALRVDNGELDDLLGPVLDSGPCLIIGFTERDRSGRTFNAAAVVSGGRVAGVCRKVNAGWWTVFRPSDELPVFQEGGVRFGVMICNDLWSPDPARALASAGAAVIFAPTNSGHLRTLDGSGPFRARSDNMPIARAVDTATTVVVADIAGRQGDRVAPGFTAVVDPDGVVLGRAEPLTEGLVIADVDPCRRSDEPAAWEGCVDASVTPAFVDLRR